MSLLVKGLKETCVQWINTKIKSRENITYCVIELKIEMGWTVWIFNRTLCEKKFNWTIEFLV